MDEKMRILKMLSEGSISAEQAAGLLEALENDGSGRENGALEPVISSAAYDKKLFRILVKSAKGDNIKVQFPVGGVKRILKATGKLPIKMDNMEGINMEDIMNAVIEGLDAQMVGDFVTVDSAAGDHVRVFVE